MSGNKKNIGVLGLMVVFGFLLNTMMIAQPEKMASPQVESDTADIYLNFEDASLESVVNYLAEQKKINLIPHKDLKGKKVSLTTREPLTLARAWNVLLTLLEVNGFTIIKVDNVYRIVPNKTNQKEPLPFYSSNKGMEPEDLPESDLVVRYVYILKNISTQVAGKILNDLLGPGKVLLNKDLATCIITDKCFNIKAAMKIVKELDIGGLRESIKIIRLRYTEAQEIANIFTTQIMDIKTTAQKTPIRFFGPAEKKEITYFSSTTKIIPEPRHNALILLGMEDHINRIIDFIHNNLDIPMEAASSRLHIKELKYVEATKLKPILTTMIKPPSTGQKTPIVGEFKFFEDVVIHAENPKRGDESRGSGNRLIISCNKDDWRRLDQLIDKLDKPQPQVAIEVMIVDIDEATTKELGAQIREKTGKSLAKGLTVFTTNMQKLTIDPAAQGGEDDPEGDPSYNPDLGAVANGLQGTTAITVGEVGDIWLVIKSFLSRTDTNIITQPFMVTQNNVPATQITQLRKRVPGKIAVEGGKNVQRFENVDATTKLKITPRINLEGLVDLQIQINLSEFLGTGDADRPSRSTREIKTRIGMATGEVLVMGGLTRSKVTVNQYKTPILGDIPIIGNLFKSKTKQTTKTNLYLFIRPSIIKPRFEGGPDEYSQLKLDYAKYQIMNVEGLRQNKDPIQRWFFKPEKQSITQKMSDLRRGLYRPIDEYTEGKRQPRSVRIERDPYYRAQEAIEAEIVKKRLQEQEKKDLFKRQQKQKQLLASRKKEIIFEAVTPNDEPPPHKKAIHEKVFGEQFPGEQQKKSLQQTVVQNQKLELELPSLRKRRRQAER